MKIRAFSSVVIMLFLISCQKDTDPCEDLSCLNGGTCLDGICECPPGYSGLNCENFEACDTISCLNGATCESGICNCPPGYSGPTCADFDPCFELVCENDGTCIDGLCDCLPNYSGENCENQITPISIVLSGIGVNSFPTLDENGNPWDDNSLPDILPQILKNNEVVFEPSAGFSNVQPGSISSWQLGNPFTFSEIFEEYSVRLMELNDNDETRVMGSISFTPYSSNNDFPEIIELVSDSLHFRLQLQYSW